MHWHTNRRLVASQAVPEPEYFRLAYDFLNSWSENQPHYQLHTSGSTGQPKPINLLREQLVSSAHLTGKAIQLPKGTRALVCLNVRYIAGVMMLVRGMELDWDLTIVEPSGNPLLQVPTEQVFDFVAMVPLQLSTILENKVTRKRVSSLGKVLLGGAPVGVALHKQIRRLNISVYQSYGMTETVSHVALRLLNGKNESEDFTLLDGVDFGVDQRGCLYVSGPMTLHQTVQTNDLVEITSDRTFRWIGRVDHVINSGGIKIPLDKVDQLVEQILYDIGCPFDCFSWFEPEEKLGQRLILVVKNRDVYFPTDNVCNEIKQRESVYLVPKHIYFVDEFIKTPTDKVDRRRTVALLKQVDE
ncbi:AMP-binding protein [Telluribacter humicola]|uniref:AMP-binding protein n=1 Tax=Telluribacter humicola TaxID=1720261 RepID=UPI001A96E64F|nr:AMP-binding protein [Telluribacter humicola]